jgi:voltage-gated potassium channel
MASEMLRPTVVDFLDSMLRSSQGNIRINQLDIKKNSHAIGKKISDLELAEKFNLVLLGSRYQDREIHFNPPASSVITEDLAIIIMGDVEDIARAKKAF